MLADVLPAADLIINATSAGLHGGDEFGGRLERGADADAIATDLVYVPLVTPFLQQRRASAA